MEVQTNVCSETKRDGTPCKGVAIKGKGYCVAHDPARSNVRSLNARRGGLAGGRGRGKTSLADEVAGVIAYLEDLKSKIGADPETIEGAVGSRVGQTLIGLANAQLKAIKLRHELCEAAEIERRLDGLEAQQGVAR